MSNNKQCLRSESINEEEQVTFGYDVEAATPSKCGKSRSSIRVSSLPKDLQQSASMMVVDNSGELGPREIGDAITSLQKKATQNRNLKKTIVAFVVVVAFMIGAVFAVTITAARLSQVMTVNPENGFAYTKGSTNKAVLKTSPAIEFTQGTLVGEMSNKELRSLREIILMEGNLRFVVKGHSRDIINDTVLLIVEGGTITYDRDHLVSSTGNAKMIFEAIFGADAHVEGSDDNRRLWCACGEGDSTGSEENEELEDNDEWSNSDSWV